MHADGYGASPEPVRGHMLVPLPSLAARARCLLYCAGLLLFAPLAARAVELQSVAVAPGAFAFLASLDEPTVDNGGFTGNAGFIVGPAGVVVVDTGPSLRHGQAMLRAIASATPLPVKLAINTQGVQDFLFGNAAFSAAGVPLLTHRKSADLMRSRCEHCLANLRQLLGTSAMSGTRVVVPENLVDASTVLDIAGLHLQLMHFGWGATPGDLAVFDPASGTLFTGALVSVERIPDLRDGRIDGWLRALDALDQVPARHVVPGHGPVGDRSSIARTRAYLLALDAQVRALYAAGRSLMQAVDEADLPEYRHWALYPPLHRRNVQQRYLELEIEDLERQ